MLLSLPKLLTKNPPLTTTNPQINVRVLAKKIDEWFENRFWRHLLTKSTCTQAERAAKPEPKLVRTADMIPAIKSPFIPTVAPSVMLEPYLTFAVSEVPLNTSFKFA